MDKPHILNKRASKQSFSRRPCKGFTYIGLLIAVAIMGVTLATIGTFWHTVQQRAKEQQLLFIGNQFSQAINAYYQNTPGGVKQFPKRLEDLLQDKRQPYTARYLRKLFADPITGNTQWGLIKGADGGIMGVRSLSDAAPLKKANFGRGYEQFVGKKRYSDWQFIYTASSTATMLAGAAGGAAGAGMRLPTRGGTPANNGAPVSVAPPANNNVPPAYRVPPPPPLPKDATPDQRKANLCQITYSTDAIICANVAAKFGDPAGMTCMASANQRHAICIGTDTGWMPVLAVQYQ